MAPSWHAGGAGGLSCPSPLLPLPGFVVCRAKPARALLELEIGGLVFLSCFVLNLEMGSYCK